MSRRGWTLRFLAVTSAGLLSVTTGTASASTPFLGSDLPRGSYTRVAEAPDPCPAPLAIKGTLGDWGWCGSSAGYAGAAGYSRGEYVYQDYVFDALGAASDTTAARGQVLDPLAQEDPDAYRLDALAQFGLGTQYGAGALQPGADLLELRVASDVRHLWVLARTTTFTATEQPGLVLLFDTAPGQTTRTVPFDASLKTTRAELAALVTPAGAKLVDLRTGRQSSLQAAADPSGYDNALEVRLPRAALLGPDRRLHVAAATGEFDPKTGGLKAFGSGPRVANIAFRPQEPVRSVFDKQQALALHDATIDPFFATVDPAKLDAGRTERLEPRGGYHVRIIREPEGISKEQGKDGVYQDYGLYVPTAYDGSPARTTVFLHGSGYTPHDQPALTPGIFRELGEERDGIMIAPRARTGFSWYEAAGLVDVLQAMDDAASVVAIDPRRTYMTGYSMGGFGCLLLSELFPDRFAGQFEIAGPTGGPNRQTGGPPLVPDLLPTAENLRWVPTAIYHGVPDEQVQYTDGLRLAGQLQALGLRYRLYTLPGEHYAPGVLDQWAEAASYLDRYRLDPNPPRVTYVRSMKLEHDVEKDAFGDEQIFPPGGLQFSFDSAYWVSGLEPRDATNGIARVDARSLAIPDPPRHPVPEAGAGVSPDQTQPWVLTGQAWQYDPVGSRLEPRNALSATLEGASAVALDLARMRIDPARAIEAKFSTDGPLALTLIGAWKRVPAVNANGTRLPTRIAHPVRRSRRACGGSRRSAHIRAHARRRGRRLLHGCNADGNRIMVTVPAGTSTLTITPRGR
jgi:predicted esterase